MTEKRNLRVAVVGVGSMGRHHARVFSQMKDLELVAVVDRSAATAQEIASAYACQHFADVSELPADVDACSVAVPTGLHTRIAVPLLEKGIHCLIEKPIAADLKGVIEIEQAASRGKALVQVGHVERYNPAVQELKQLLRNETIRAFDVRRLGPHPRRVLDVDVVLDLMIHDIDIVTDLAQSEVTTILARGLSVSGTRSVDHAIAILGFADGKMASLTASRITEEQIRTLALTADDIYVDLDYTSKRLTTCRRSHMPPPTNSGYQLEATVQRIFVPQAEPLSIELQDFVTAIRERRKPLVGIPEAAKALSLALQIQENIMRGIDAVS